MSEDMPEDLSVKYRSVAVQTETVFQDKLEAIFEELSQNQIKYFLDALLTLVSKEENESIDQKKEYYKDLFKQLKILSPKLAPEWKQQEPEPSTRTYTAPSPAISFQHPQHKEYRPFASRTSPALNKAGRIKTSPSSDKTQMNKINLVLKMYTEEEHDKVNKISFYKEQQMHFDGTLIQNDENKGIAEELNASSPFGQMSKDKRLVLKMRIPLTIEDIINTSMEVFNELVSRQDVTEDQMNICRDIRRRGKNKIAAQNCRKRKICQIHCLEVGLVHARNRKENILSERVKLLWRKQEMSRKLDMLERDILDKMGKDGNMMMIGVDCNRGVRVENMVRM